MNIIEELEKEQIAKLSKEGGVPDFAPGDTIRVHVKVVEGSRERVQIFEGVCIARKNAGLNSSFTVRKLSYGEGVERVFPLYSPRVADIEVVRRGRVRRAKLYYLRGRTGKRARITEKTSYRVGGPDVSAKAKQVATSDEAFAAGEAADLAPEVTAKATETAGTEDAKKKDKAAKKKAAKVAKAKAKDEKKAAKNEKKATKDEKKTKGGKKAATDGDD